MAFKPTRRRNGQNMVTIQIKYTFDHDDLVKIVAAGLWYDHYDDERETSKAVVEKAVREFYGVKGSDGLIDIRDNLMDDEDEALDWADVQVRRLYPELT